MILNRGFGVEYIRSVYATIFRTMGSQAFNIDVFGVTKNAIAIGLHTDFPGADQAPLSNEVPTANTGYGRKVVPATPFYWGITEENGSIIAYNRRDIVFNKNLLADWGTLQYASLAAAHDDGIGSLSTGLIIGYIKFNDPDPLIRVNHSLIIPGSGDDLGHDAAGLKFVTQFDNL